jgi:hypothetical protein
MTVKHSSKRKWMRRAALATGLLVTYPFILLGIEYSASKWSPKITTKTELQQVIDKRKEKLGIEEHIEGVLRPETIGMSGTSINSGMKKIYVGGDLATQIVVDHELYHNHKRDNEVSQIDTIKERLETIYLEEPCARIYSLLRIRL